MKVTVVEFAPAGGLYQFAVQLVDAYADLGAEVTLLTGRRPELLPRNPRVLICPVLPTWRPDTVPRRSWLVRKSRRCIRAARHLLAWWITLRWLRRNQSDVVQCGEWRFPVDGWFAALLRRRHPWTVLVDVAHTPRPFSEQRTHGSLYKSGWPLHDALGRAYAACDVVVVLGDRARTDLLGTFPRVRRVEVVPHGDEGIYHRTVPAPDSCGEVVLFFGTLARYKGLDALLEAFRLVRAQRPHATLVVAGAVADVDLASLQRHATGIGGVLLRPGYVPVDRVAELVGSARLLVTPYDAAYESGVVRLAQTLGRPVVTTDVGDLGQAVRDGETGLVVAPRDVPALAAAVTRLLADPAEATRMGTAGRARLGTERGWEQAARRLLAVFGEVRGERTSATPVATGPVS